ILQGYGGRLAFYLPFMDHRLILEPSVSARFLDGTTTGDGAFGRFNDRFEVIDTSVRAHWVFSSAWRLTGGLSYAYTSEVQRILVDLGLSFRW
ncbi:MAG: hypothetical protein AAF517_14110, partial [Planctomycetota bacterium]